MEKLETKYSLVAGVVLGNMWGGGTGCYESRTIHDATDKSALMGQIQDMLEDGTLDGGGGFESLIGAVVEIWTEERIMIDGKVFTTTDGELVFFGSLNHYQKQALMDVFNNRML